MAAYHSEFITDLALPPVQRPISHQFAMGDNNAYTFTALVCNSEDLDAALMAGSVSGVLLRPDGTTVALAGEKGDAVQQVRLGNGTLANATPCSVTLPQACFAYPGRVLLSIKLVDGTTSTTVLSVAGVVNRTESDSAVDPGDIIPDLATLQAAAAEALDAADAATEAADHAVQYDAAQSLTEAQRTQARMNIGASLGVTAYDERLRVTGTMRNEWVSGGSVITSATHLMSQIITVDSYVVCAVDLNYGYNIAAFLYAEGVTDRANYSSATGWRGAFIVLQPGERYAVALQKPGSNVTPDDLQHVRVFYGYGKPGYTQTPGLASVTTFATIRKPGCYLLDGTVDITNANRADLPAGYVTNGNVLLTVQEIDYNNGNQYLQTLYTTYEPYKAWFRYTNQFGAATSAWTEIVTNTSVLAGKKVSFYGDSITTFSGYIPSGNVAWYPHSGVDVTQVTDCWWKKTLDVLGLQLLVNNSYSGRQVRTSGYLPATIEKLGTDDADPDIIVILMGINDFNQEVPIGTYDGTSAVPPIVVGQLPASFTDAYGIMLDGIMKKFPLARVYCCTLINQDYNGGTDFPEINGNGVPLTTWNEAIKKLAFAFGAEVIDLYTCGITHYNLSTYIGDYGAYSDPDYGVHPNKAGHSLMANQAIQTMDGSVKTRY